MTGRIFIDTFSSMDDLPKKFLGDEGAVFEVLRKTLRVSTFEMNAKLHATLKRLEAKGRITRTPSGYPWIEYKINESGGE